MTLRRYAALRSKPQADPVTAEVRRFVLARDGGCIAFHLDPTHVCRDRFARPHDPHALDMLSLEHVKDALMAGKRAPSDPAHLIALCFGANLRPPTKDQRAGFRAYLRGLTANVRPGRG